jgi:homoserine kinase
MDFGSHLMSPDRSVTAFAPGTVGNVVCGFDVLGLAIESPGDSVTVRSTSAHGLRISSILGDGGRLPLDPGANSATIGISALLEGTGRTEGIEVALEKGLPLSGGMGGSAASAVAAVVAMDHLLETNLPPSELLSYALAGERAAAGAGHLDNVAPALLGGLLLVRQGKSPEVIRLPVPVGMSVALLHPSVELSTKEGRQAIGSSVPLGAAVAQWGNTAAFVHGLHTNDWDLIADALEDRIAEPHRQKGIPGFLEVREAALAAGAVACGISGAGPSIVSICRNTEDADRVGATMLAAYEAAPRPRASLYRSPVSPLGARIVAPVEGSAQ